MPLSGYPILVAARSYEGRSDWDQTIPPPTLVEGPLLETREKWRTPDSE
jgi:hypothetical protein